MGMRGYLALINATPYEWNLTYQHSYQMNGWSSAFPNPISSGAAVQIYVEFEEVFAWQDDAAEANFSFGPSSSPFWFQVQARGNYDGVNFDPHLQILFGNFQTPGNPPGTTLDLGWNHGYPTDFFGTPLNPSGNGCVTFILSMDPAGNLHSSADGNWSTWMQDNLGTLGGRTLRQFCLPGTHDSGMSQIGSCRGGDADNTQTQTQGILAQLEQGARYFDIRPVISDGIFVTGHYGYIDAVKAVEGCNGQSIAGIISDINSFTSNRAELMILYLSDDWNTDGGKLYSRGSTRESGTRCCSNCRE